VIAAERSPKKQSLWAREEDLSQKVPVWENVKITYNIRDQGQCENLEIRNLRLNYSLPGTTGYMYSSQIL